MQYVCDKQGEVRQAAAYGIGVMAQYGGQGYLQAYTGTQYGGQGYLQAYTGTQYGGQGYLQAYTGTLFVHRVPKLATPLQISWCKIVNT